MKLFKLWLSILLLSYGTLMVASGLFKYAYINEDHMQILHLIMDISNFSYVPVMYNIMPWE